MELELELVPLSMMISLPSVAALIVVVGDSVSTAHLNDAGEKLIFPTASTALTVNV
jgi:hypothetical protein